MTISVGRYGLYSGFARLGELRPPELNTARLSSRQRVPRPRSNHRPLFLGKGREQVQDERVYVCAKLGDEA